MTTSGPALIAASLLGAATTVICQYFLRKRSKKRLWKGPPHPNWKPPDRQNAPFEPVWHDIDSETLPGDVLYPLVISSITPRPIALLSTLGENGEGNVAPYSYFNIMSHNPPHVAIGCCSSAIREHGKKDSLLNILTTKEFVVNLISEWFVEAANHCCGNFDYGENEMELSGLTPVTSLKVKPPRVRESAVHLECRLVHSYDIVKNGKVTTTIVIGEVVMMHIAEDIAGRSPSGKLIVDVNKMLPISRLGGNIYGRTREIFELPRPDRSTIDNKALAYSSTTR